MTTSVQDIVDDAEEAVVDLADELVYETEAIHPEDMTFICSLFSEYYSSHAEREAGSVVTCDIAWALANELIGYIENTDDFDWINAHFLIDDLYRGVSIELLELPSQSYEATNNPSHPSEFDWDGEALQYSDGFVSGEDAITSVTEVLELYIPFDDSVEQSKDISETKSLAGFFHILQTRYASDYPDDSAERNAQLQFTQFVLEVEESDRANKRELYNALRLVKQWTEQRAKREHQMLCVGLLE